MPQPDAAFTAVVLAAQRAGQIDPLAARAGLSHKCLVPIADAPLIAHVASALLATPGCARLRIVVEAAMFLEVRSLFADRHGRIDCVVAADNLADSVFRAVDGIDGPIVVTTADNVLLTPGAVSAMVDALRDGADAALAMATKASVMAAHAEGQRRYYRFSDDEYSNCNLYALNGERAARAAESFRSGGQFAKKPLRLLATIGPINVALMLLHRLSLREALAKMSKRLKLDVVPVILADGSHAIDVDNERTYRVAEELLGRRARADCESPRIAQSVGPLVTA